MKLLPLHALPFVFLPLGGCSSNEPIKMDESAKSVDSPFAQQLFKVGTEYKSWDRVDDLMRWAPELCLTPNPAQLQLSSSRDEQTHGKKLYSLFASKRNEYVLLSATQTASVGQVVVKQSWVPVEITDPNEKPKKIDEFQKNLVSGAEYFYPYVWKGEKVFKASKQADLFVMMKLDPNTAGTDEGWVYATLTPDGKTLTSAGAIESCMKCHRDAKNDRLFGLAK